MRTISPDLALSVSATLARVFQNFRYTSSEELYQTKVPPVLQRFTGRRKPSCSTAFCVLQISSLCWKLNVHGSLAVLNYLKARHIIWDSSRQIVSMSYQRLSYLYQVIGRATSLLPQFFVLWWDTIYPPLAAWRNRDLRRAVSIMRRAGFLCPLSSVIFDLLLFHVSQYSVFWNGNSTYCRKTRSFSLEQCALFVAALDSLNTVWVWASHLCSSRGRKQDSGCRVTVRHWLSPQFVISGEESHLA